jgi:fibrillarin-like pre-rRNA processing protein
MKETNFSGIYEKRKGRYRLLYTKNLVPGKSVYGEQLVNVGGAEYREWDIHKSKLAASIIKGLNQLSLSEGDVVVYLGASTGTTVSHVSDIVGSTGFVFAVDLAPRVVRELVFLCEERPNIAPILADANDYKSYFHRVVQADFLYQDIAQKNQAEIFLKNMVYLAPDGFGMLCVKSRSIDIRRKPKEIYREVRGKLEKDLHVVDYRVLDPFQKDHCVFVCKKK